MNPVEGTPEFNKHYLVKLYRWLKLNPKNNPVVDDEAKAVKWALEQLFGEDVE